MRQWSWIFILALLALPGLAAWLPAAADRAAWGVWSEHGRLKSLLGNTAGLAVIAMAVAVPGGTVLGVILSRLRVPGRGCCLGLLIAWLVVPLPVLAVAWQAVLGTWLPGLMLGDVETAWRPWASGLLPAGVVHGFAAFPWVAVIVRAVLHWSDQALEEEALVVGGVRLALARAIGPRLWPAMIVSACWVAVLTFTEIAVTDAMMVRTLAEEVYIQFVSAGGGSASAMLVMMPMIVAGVVGGLVVSRWLAPQVALNRGPAAAGFVWPVGAASRAAAAGFVYTVLSFCCLFPLAALVWKVCGGGVLAEASVTFGLEQVSRVVWLNGRVLVQSLAAALLTGWLASQCACWLAWSVRGRFWAAAGLAGVIWFLALTPGPVLGFGLKSIIFALYDAEDWVLACLGIRLDHPPLRSLLYDQPSPLPGILAAWLRFMPVAAALVLPVVWTVPRDLLELARQDGVSAWRYVGRPHLQATARLTLLAVAALALGEVSAAKLVNPPGHRIFILELFDQMHYGTEPMVAAMSLTQLLLSLLLAGAVVARLRRTRR